MGIFDSFVSAVTSFASSLFGGSSDTQSGGSKPATTTPASTPAPSKTTTNNGTARSNSPVNSKYNYTHNSPTTQPETKPKITGTVDEITVGQPTTPATSEKSSGTARSNNPVNSKYTAETPTHSSAKEYTNPADTVPKTTTQVVESKPENKVYDAGGNTTPQTYAVETGFQKNVEAISQIAEDTLNNNSIIPFVDSVISWRDEQYDKAAGHLEEGNLAETALSIIPPFLADVAFPLDALNVTNKIGAHVAGASDEVELSEYELQIGGIDALISAIPIIGPAQRLIKTASKAFGTGTKTATEAAETTTSKALKEIAEETGESAISKVAKEGTEEAAETAAKNTPVYKVARVVDTVATPIVGTVATFALLDSTTTETTEETIFDETTEEPTEETIPSPYDFSEVPETDIWNSGNFWEGGTSDTGEVSWIDYGAAGAPAAYSVGIDAEIDRIIKDYTAPALIALVALVGLAVANYALTKGGKTNG